ncbi:hypothetical protein I4U23_023304 [Adineta vaga]|nr:hypothetical protein I4U23_023304 [Adineta vaga]
MYCACEWLTYVLGRKMDLPINIVQIAIYHNNRATLNTDVCEENEKIISTDELPRKIRKILMTDSIIQNADRNAHNILITTSNTTDMNNENAKLKVHFIDHGACFGMGKLHGVSVLASKIRRDQFSVVQFDPIEQAKEFERYLSKLSPDVRVLLGNTLNRSASIPNEQFECWFNQIQELLTSSQYSCIVGVCDTAGMVLLKNVSLLIIKQDK